MDPRSIRPLPSEVIDQIAAGEVIERPASVVKELVENALDAGATAVRVELEGGGLDRVAVIDDGAGIAPDELRLAIARHATSKLRGAEELTSIRSLGFRGEALSSMAAVARLTITSRRAQEPMGTRLRSAAGEVIGQEHVGSPVGTEIEVRELFFNTPARRKFMRSPATEQAHAIEAALRTVLGARRGGLVVLAGGRRLVDLSEQATQGERVRVALGRRVEEIFDFAHEVDGIRVSGYFAPPQAARSDGRGLLFYVNGRQTRDRLLQRAAIEGYRSLLERGRYPVAVVYVDVAPEAVDVNVHPQKLEVRFHDSNAVFRAVAAGLASELARTPWVQRQAQWVREPRDAAYSVAPSPAILRQDALPAVSPTGFFSRLRPVGQVLGLYLVCEGEEEIVLVDQHAAHERIAFERLRHQAAARGIEQQQLLFPHRLVLDATAAAALGEQLQAVAALGFDIELLGPATFVVRAVPSVLARADVSRLVEDLLADLGQLDGEAGGRTLADRTDALLSRCACHAAVRGGDAMGPAEIRALLADLDAVDFGAACPHGRPVYHRIERPELERLFHRR